MLVAFVLALPVAINRERYSQIMGLRTFPLVSLGACAYVLVAQSIVDPGSPDSTMRVVQGVLTGIGFLGGGAILKGDNRVRGTATAATIWGLGAMGLAVAFDQWMVAAGLSLLMWLTLSVLFVVKEEVDHDYDREHDSERASSDD
ncbi:MAG: MgtC/SapB family protein [Wenzhouxiangella sp.]|nr:MgtC/SapB family protein [Wenzhouxiangella sp.]